MILSSYSLLGLVILVFDIIAIANVLGGSTSTERKALWTLAILLLPVVGMVLYFFVGRSRQDKITN